jgi:site-specific DNA-methyltransferase (adenine-specific)
MSTERINSIICGDSLQVIDLITHRPTVIFADPPDNLAVAYDGDRTGDDLPAAEYDAWLGKLITAAMSHAPIVWLSYFHKHQPAVMSYLQYGPGGTAAAVGRLRRNWDSWRWRQFIWHFTFGQHNAHDCGTGYRPLLRISNKSATFYPDAIRVPSARQTTYKDKRADPRGRVPDDVWQFSRVCGTFAERREWFPNQHPQALLERLVRLSAKPGDLVVDMFAGSGSMLRTCAALGLDCIGIEQSRHYCEQIAADTGATILELDPETATLTRAD